MRMVDLIELKKQGKAFTEAQLNYIIKGYCNEQIPDYQMSALLMAICFKGLNKEETILLTKIMRDSGEIIDLSGIAGVKVDKHSTGGVGDKATLVLSPMVAACGVKVAKMSGRGLGHTGGTIDKLESIEGFQVQISQKDFIQQVNEIGLAIVSQSNRLVPADKKIYALRDVTATVDCMALIASSIMSKKLASGCDTILLDVKYGQGAFMQTKEEAIKLAKLMIEIGKRLNKDTRATISNMNQPLGKAIGNTLEVIEAINTLKGQGPDDLLELCLEAGSQMLVQAKKCRSHQEAVKMLKQVITNGQALEKFRQMVRYQHGNDDYITNLQLFKSARYIIPVKSLQAGYVKNVQAKKLGIIAMKLGGGRQTKDDIIDHAVGIVLNKKIGDYCRGDEVLGYLHTNRVVEQELIIAFYQAYEIVDYYVAKPLLIEEILE